MCFVGTTHKNCCSLNTQNANDKRQSGVSTKPTSEGFKPRTSATLSVI